MSVSDINRILAIIEHLFVAFGVLLFFVGVMTLARPLMNIGIGFMVIGIVLRMSRK